jgi:tRNA-dihydrouridine synthase
MQLTAQEIGTLLREECAPIVVINNDGYTIKRAGTCLQVTGDNCLLIRAALTPSAGLGGG